MRKKLIALACLVFVAGLLIGSISLRDDIANNQYKTYQVDANIVHAYFKVYNISAESGIGYNSLVSYVFVLNLTNPSDITLRLSELILSSASIIDLHRYFSDVSSDYYFYPHTSTLVAFSDTGGGVDAKQLELGGNGPSFTMAVGFSATQGRGGGSALTSSQLPLEKISADEFVYGSTFKAGSYFVFNNQNLRIDRVNVSRIG